MKKIFLGFFLVFLSIPLLAWTGGTNCPTEGLVPCGTEGCPCEFCDFFKMIKKFIDGALFYFVPVLAGLMIAIGGFMMIMSYGGGLVSLEGGKKGGPVLLGRAKKLFSAVIFGLLIIYGAWIIVNTFFQIIGVETWTGLEKGWWQINCD